MYERILDNDGNIMRVIPIGAGERCELFEISKRFKRIADGTIKGKRHAFIRALRKLYLFCENRSLTMVFHDDDGVPTQCSSLKNTPWFSAWAALYDAKWGGFVSTWYEEESERFANLLEKSVNCNGDCYIRKVEQDKQRS